MLDQYGLAAFRSRTQALRMEAGLRRLGAPAQVVTTPRAVSLGCGLSVRFPLEYAQAARSAAAGQPGLIGLYRVEQRGARIRVAPLGA